MMTGDINRIREALQFIPVGGHDERVRLAFMLKSEFGDSGRELWDEWRDGRGDDEAASVWKSASETGTLKIGTLIHEAKASGWRDDGGHRKPTAEELAERRRTAAERAAKEETEKARIRADTSKKAAAIRKATTEAKADNPYLSRKRVSPVATLREIDASTAAAILGYAPKSGGELLTGRLLVVPVKQGDDISTLELIDGDKRKAALAGRGSKAGGYWATERLPDANGNGLTLLIGEGVATVLSAKEASGHVALAALSSGNLPAVAKAMRERYPAAVLVILADLVKATGAPDPHAIEAAQSVGGLLAIPDFGTDRPVSAKDFNDMANLCGTEAVGRAIANASAPSGNEYQPAQENVPADDTDDWAEPQPIVTRVAPEPYPIDALPDTIRAAVEEVGAFVKAPVPMVATCAISAVSLAAQAHYDVQRAEKLHSPIGLFTLILATSGERKSTCDSFFMQAIRDYEAQQAEAAKPFVKEYNAASAIWEAKHNGIKDKIRQLAKEKKPTHELETDMRDLENNKPEAPRIPRLTYSNITTEELLRVLAKKWPSGGVVTAEGGIVFGSHAMKGDAVMGNLATLNALWDGGDVPVDRKTTESFNVHGARLTVALQVQPETIETFFEKNGTLARGTGFLARFLLAWPESTQGHRPFTEAPANWPSLAAFNRRITEILNQPVPIDENGSLTPLMLTLTPEAKTAWIEYHDAIESELASGGELFDVRDVASKSADNAARLAAEFHVFEGGIGAIGADTFHRASRITAWHLNESRRFFGELALPAELADAARLDTWLIDYCRRERTHLVPIAKLQQCGPGRLRSKATIEIAMRELADASMSRVRWVQDGKRKMIAVNPALLSEGAS